MPGQPAALLGHEGVGGGGIRRARDDLDDKVNRLFAGKVVRKDLVRKVKVGANVPVFVLGESMGASVAMAALAPRADAPPVAGLILTAPAVWNGSDLPNAYRTALRVLSSVLPMLRVSARHVRVQASDNVEMLYALGRDPLYLRYTRLDAVAGLVDLMTDSQQLAPSIPVPMLVLLGARDQIVRPPASRRFVATLDPARCSVATYVNGWHLLLRDHQREEVFADILAWVDGTPLPSGLDHPCGPPAPVPALS